MNLLSTSSTAHLVASDRSRRWLWFSAAMLVVIMSAALLRYGTNVLDTPTGLDEGLMKVPVDDIAERGWSRETMLDYQEVKGPAFFWSYAALAQLFGSETNDLRFITMFFYIGGAVPLLLIMMRCTTGRLAGPSLIAAAGFYILLPYNAKSGQLFMSEPSFTFLAMWLMWTFVWGYGNSAESEKRILGPLLFAVILSILLHSRPHALAFAGAAALVSFERDGIRAWPWWLACIAAGLSRLPLWLYWGGFVTSDYQNLFTTGFRLEPATYLLIAAVPLLWVFLWPSLAEARHRRHWPWVAGGAGLGLLLGLIFRPDVNALTTYFHPAQEVLKEQQAYAGIMTTVLRTLAPEGWIHAAAVVGLSTMGGAALGAMLILTWSRTCLDDGQGVVRRLAFWTLVAGIALFTLTSSPVYDRYLQVWAVLLPAFWVWALPRWLLIVHAVALAAMLAVHISEWVT